MFPSASIELTGALLSDLTSFSLDYAARQKVGGTHLKHHVFKQLLVLPPSTYSQPASWDPASPLSTWLTPRVLELTYTAWDLEAFARDLGYTGPPFRWDPARRFLLRCELDAAFFHLYLPSEPDGSWRPAANESSEDLARLKACFPTAREAVFHIMDSFPIVKRKDEEKQGDYRTKLQIFDIYDRMQVAIATGVTYQTLIDPPPADPRVAHPDTRRQEGSMA